MNPGADLIPHFGGGVNRYIYSMTIVVHMYYPREVPKKLQSGKYGLPYVANVTQGGIGGHSKGAYVEYRIKIFTKI